MPKPNEIIVEMANGQIAVYPAAYQFGIFTGGYLEIIDGQRLVAGYSPVGWHAVYREHA